MSEALTSKIFQTGTKFMVTDTSKDTTIGPGSTGFVSYVKGHDQDYANVVYIRFISTRRGKTGKERIERQDLSMPIFDIDDKDAASMLPDPKRKFFVNIEPVEFNVRSIEELDDMDFLGWALAWSTFLRKLNSRSQYISAWPSGDKLLDNLATTDSFFADNPTFAKEQLAAAKVRKGFTNSIRMIESTLRSASLSYMKRVAGIEKEAARAILNSKLEFAKNPIAQNTLKTFVNKYKALDTLNAAKNKDGKKKGLPAKAVKKATDNLSWS